MGFFAIVPQQSIYVTEFLGKYKRQLLPGLRFFFPFIERIRNRCSLKEQTFELQKQFAVTRDNVMISIDGILYYKIHDPVKATYGAQQPIVYTQLLAMSIMRSQVGKLTLDQTFEQRDAMNLKILEAIQLATEDWGIKCTRYQIKDIIMSDKMKSVMNQEAQAQRIKRAQILRSQGIQTSDINFAEGQQRSIILSAQGKATAFLLQTEALTNNFRILNNVIDNVGPSSFNFIIAQNYMKSLRSLQGKQIIMRRSLDPKKSNEEANNLLSK